MKSRVAFLGMWFAFFFLKKPLPLPNLLFQHVRGNGRITQLDAAIIQPGRRPDLDIVACCTPTPNPAPTNQPPHIYFLEVS